MSLMTAIKESLESVEQKNGKRIPWAVATDQNGVRIYGVTVWPMEGEPHVRKFDLHDGFTPNAEEAIRAWFEPLVRSN